MKASWNGATLAESNETIQIEGNEYFPPSSVDRQYFSPSDHATSCVWKGHASYFDVSVNGDTNAQAAWYYREPMEGSAERVGTDYTGYVAFWKGVDVG